MLNFQKKDKDTKYLHYHDFKIQPYDNIITIDLLFLTWTKNMLLLILIYTFLHHTSYVMDHLMKFVGTPNPKSPDLSLKKIGQARFSLPRLTKCKKGGVLVSFAIFFIDLF